MKKRKFLLTTHHKHPKDYDLISPPDYEKMAWERMLQEIPRSGRYLKHFIEDEFVDTSDKDGFYTVSPDLEIPLGELRIYLIVYAEDIK